MGYDIDMHIPGQVDFFLQSFNNKNLDGIGQSLDTLMELVKDNGFKNDIKNYEINLELKKKKIQEETIKKIHSIKTLDEAIIILHNYEEDYNNIYNDYWKIIKSYIIGYFKKIE